MTTISVGGLLVLGISIGVSFKAADVVFSRLVDPVVRRFALRYAPDIIVSTYDDLHDTSDDLTEWEQR
jgi:hypothetical protein